MNGLGLVAALIGSALLGGVLALAIGVWAWMHCDQVAVFLAAGQKVPLAARGHEGDVPVPDTIRASVPWQVESQRDRADLS